MVRSSKFLGTALAACFAVQSVWAADPAPPAMEAMPAPPMPMPEEAPPLFGPAPKAAAPMPPSKDGKVRKEQRRKKQADSDNCLSKSVTVVGRPIIPLFTQGENSTTAVRVAPRVGLSSCDAVLALPVDSEDAWDRRAIWLQGRATHLIGLGAYDAAVQSLDEADAIGAARKDMLFDGGAGVGNAMLRAYALGKLGRRDAALSEIARGRALRPYAIVNDRAFARIEDNLENSVDAMLERATARVKWQPDSMRYLLPQFIWRGNMQGATRIVDDVSTINPKPIGGWTISGTQSAVAQLTDDVEMQLQRAYVWAALGNREKSASIIAGTQADIAEFIGEKPVAEQYQKVPKYKMEEYDARVKQGKAVELLVARWEAVIQLRAEAAIRPAEELFERADQLDAAGMIVGLDLLRQFRFSNPAEQIQVNDLLARADAKLSQQILGLEPNGLHEMLPDPEYLNDVPRFGGAGDGILFGRENGFSQAKEKDSDIRTIRFGTTSGSGAMADELALLATAQYAEKEGKDSFILLARRSVKRTTTVSGYYTAGFSYDSGYESQLRVILLDSANLPPEWADKRARLIMASDIVRDIKPRYDALEARKAASKR